MSHIEVLVVEDNASDRFWLEYNLKMIGQELHAFHSHGRRASRGLSLETRDL